MGRELKRVPLDFNWPIGKIWGGYINPFSQQSTNCPDCDGNGSSKEMNQLKDRWYGYIPFRPEDNGSVPFTVKTPEVWACAERNCSRSPVFYGDSESSILREAQRLCKLFNERWSHHLNQEEVDRLIKENRLWDFKGKNPTADEVNRWSISGMGHDSCNQWIVCRFVCEKNQWPQECPHCAGKGSIWPSKEIESQSDAWKVIEPPTGEGFQLWSTTNEGEPTSPVFDNLDSLCSWCADNATTFGHSRATAEQWKSMLSEDFVYHQEGNAIFI
jgi:hypothetical protein